jgi:hypothetical protein
MQFSIYKGAIDCSERNRLTKSEDAAEKVELKVVCGLADFRFLYNLLKRFFLKPCFSGKR